VPFFFLIIIFLGGRVVGRKRAPPILDVDLRCCAPESGTVMGLVELGSSKYISASVLLVIIDLRQQLLSELKGTEQMMS